MPFLPKLPVAVSIFSLLLYANPANGQGVRAEKPPVVVIAHRGNHVSVPENTLASCREAIRCGSDYVEVDVRTTKDGKLVLLHDVKVDRTTNGQGALSELTWKQVKHLRIAGKNRKKYRIPRFERVLKLCQGKIKIYLDFKEADVAQTWKRIQQQNMADRVIVYLNEEEQYTAWKNIAPNVPLMTSLPEKYEGVTGLKTFLGMIDVQVLDNLEIPALVEEA